MIAGRSREILQAYYHAWPTFKGIHQRAQFRDPEYSVSNPGSSTLQPCDCDRHLSDHSELLWGIKQDLVSEGPDIKLAICKVQMLLL